MSDVAILKRQIAKAKNDLVEASLVDDLDQEEGLAVLFTGNWHDAIPRKVIVDSELSAGEKILWQAIRLSIKDPTRPGAIPRRDELAALVNCSAATITTNRTMLRALRWITYCDSVRNPKTGQFVGDIYLFHDEPISLEATLNIDVSYLSFLQHLKESSSNKRLRAAAISTLKEVDQIQSLSIPNEVDRLTQRIRNNNLSHEIFSEEHLSHQSKNFDMVDDELNTENPDQLKIFEAGQLVNENDFPSTKSIQFHQSKNFDMVDQDDETGEKNFFSSRTRGSNNNNFNINKNIYTRETEKPKSVDQLLNDPKIQSAIPASPELEKQKAKSIINQSNKNPDVDPDRTIELVNDSFPWLTANSHLRTYLISLFTLRESNLPMLKRLIMELDESTQIDLVCQLVGRQAAYSHGWIKGPLFNLIAFTRELVNRAKANDFIPDDYALEIKRCLSGEANDIPMFFDSPDKTRSDMYKQDDAF